MYFDTADAGFGQLLVPLQNLQILSGVELTINVPRISFAVFFPFNLISPPPQDRIMIVSETMLLVKMCIFVHARKHTCTCAIHIHIGLGEDRPALCQGLHHAQAAHSSRLRLGAIMLGVALGPL